MKGWPLPLLSGALFALGLAISGMTQPAKVIGFLDFGGQWDPSLMFVMAGAVSVYVAGDRLARRQTKPLFAATFSRPAAALIDLRLLGGAALFGVGWGLSGFCPGPALVSLGAGVTSALWFVPAALVGMLLHQRLTHARPPADG